MGKWSKVTVMQIWLFCRMLLGRICYRVMIKRVIVEYGLKLGGDKVEDIVYSRIYFEGGIDEKLEGGGTVSGINNGNR